MIFKHQTYARHFIGEHVLPRLPFALPAWFYTDPHYPALPARLPSLARLWPETSRSLTEKLCCVWHMIAVMIWRNQYTSRMGRLETTWLSPLLVLSMKHPNGYLGTIPAATTSVNPATQRVLLVFKGDLDYQELHAQFSRTFGATQWDRERIITIITCLDAALSRQPGPGVLRVYPAFGVRNMFCIVLARPDEVAAVEDPFEAISYSVPQRLAEDSINAYTRAALRQVLPPSRILNADFS